MALHEYLLDVYRVFCQPTSFSAETRGMSLRQRLAFMLRLAPVMLLSAAVTVGSLSFLLQIVGLPFNWAPRGVWWGPALLGVATGVALGTAWRVVPGVAWGVVWGPAYWLTSRVVLPLLLGLDPEVALSLGRGLPVALALGVTLGAGASSVQGAGWGLALGLISAAIMAPMARLGGAAAAALCFWGGYFQLEWYALDVEVTLVQLLWARRVPSQARALLRRSPVYWREPIWLPLIGLRSFLQLVGDQDYRAAADECYFVITQRPTQARIARQALIAVMARHLGRLDTVQQIAAVSEELGRATVAGARLPRLFAETLVALGELSRLAEQHLTATLPHNRTRALQRLQTRAEELARRLALDQSPLAQRLLPVATHWRDAAAARLEELGEAERAAGYVHNPFVFGQPIEETETNLFVGRRDVVRQIEVSLLGGAAKPALVLWGPRRMGKTSVLLQLPRLLGSEFVPAFVDMQAMQVRESLPAFFRAITESAAAALRRRGMEAAPLTGDELAESPFSVFAHWLERLEGILGSDRQLLLCLDEFERLEASIREGRLPKEIMDQLRHIIQHHPRVVVLVSGSHRPDEMELNWPDVLISTRLIEVSYLEEEEAKQLITRPVPEFPLTYASESVSQVVRTTRCQPYLVQAVCYELVNLLNVEGLREAAPQHVAEAVQQALDSTRLYFAEMWRQLTDGQRRLLKVIAARPEGTPEPELRALPAAEPESLEAELRTLALRRVIEESDGHWRFQVPMVAEWVRTRSG